MEAVLVYEITANPVDKKSQNVIISNVEFRKKTSNIEMSQQ